MPLTTSQINDLIAVNIPNNSQQLITPTKVREVLLAMQEFADFQRTTGDTLEGVMSRGNVTTSQLILLSTPSSEVGVQFDLQGEGFAHTGELLPPDGGLTDSRQWRLPDAGGTLATQEWVIENGGGGGGGPIGLNGLTDVTLTSPATGQLLRYNGTAWVNWTPTFAAGTHTHAITDVTGLQAALDDKAPMSHAHFMADIIGLDTALAGKAAVSHTHIIADVTGLQTALDGKQAAGSYAAATHTHGLGDITGFPSQTGNSGKYLTTDGTNLSWATPPAGGVTTMAAVGSTPNANGASISGSTLTLQPASGTQPGVLTSGTQTIGGQKTFTGVVFIGSGTVFRLDGSGGYASINEYTSNSLLIAGSVISIGNGTGLQFNGPGASNGYGAFSTGTLILKTSSSTLPCDGSAQLHLESTTRGFLMPRMTITQLAAISSPAAALLAIATNDTQANAIRRYNGTAWAGAESDNWVDYSSTSTVVGWSSTTTKVIRYQLMHRKMLVQFNIAGTSNSGTTTFTLPFSLGASAQGFVSLFRGINAGNTAIVFGSVTGSTMSFTIFDAINSLATFTASGTKQIYGQFFIELD